MAQETTSHTKRHASNWISTSNPKAETIQSRSSLMEKDLQKRG